MTQSLPVQIRNEAAGRRLGVLIHDVRNSRWLKADGTGWQAAKPTAAIVLAEAPAVAPHVHQATIPTPANVWSGYVTATIFYVAVDSAGTPTDPAGDFLDWQTVELFDGLPMGIRISPGVRNLPA